MEAAALLLPALLASVLAAPPENSLYSLDVFPDSADSQFEKSNSTQSGENETANDVFSLLWYIGAFGGLVIFFLVVSCSECCCTKVPTQGPVGSSPAASPRLEDLPPPPPYDLFAPPAYESLFYQLAQDKSRIEVFVVPVHCLPPPEEETPRPPP